MWSIPELDDEYIDRMEDLLDLYERPLNPKEPVICVDERPVVLHAHARAPMPAKPRREARYDSEYVRRGTANVFCAVEPRAGRHMLKATSDRSGVEFAAMLAQIARAYRKARTIHLVLDNLSTHTEKSLRAAFGPALGSRIWNRFTVHYTPKHGSWLNQAEMEISLYSRQCLGRRRIPDLRTLRHETHAWECHANAHAIRIDWKFTTQDARRKFRYEPIPIRRSKD
jgi:transposase